MSQFPESINNKMNIYPDTYSIFNVKPRDENRTFGRIQQTLCIDSRDRNTKNYPNSNNYRLNLEKVYKDVISIELTKAIIPQTGYIINHHNNKIHIQETNNITVIISIPVGNYTITTFTTALQNAINSAVTAGNLASTYTISVNTTNNKIKLSSDLSGGDGIFKLIFADNSNKYPSGSMGYQIGFNQKNYLFAQGTVIADGTTILTGTNTNFSDILVAGDVVRIDGDASVYTISTVDSNTQLTMTGAVTTTSGVSKNMILGAHVAPNFYNLTGDSYVLLHIDELERHDGVKNSIQNAFTTIPFPSQVGSVEYILNDKLGNSKDIRYFNPPFGKMDRLTISFRDYNNNLYDFNGRDHYLEFEVYMLNKQERY